MFVRCGMLWYFAVLYGMLWYFCGIGVVFCGIFVVNEWRWVVLERYWSGMFSVSFSFERYVFGILRY